MNSAANLAVLLILGLSLSVGCTLDSSRAASTTSTGQGTFHDGDFVFMPSLRAEVQRHEVTYRQWATLNAELPADRQSPWTSKDDCFEGHSIKNTSGDFPVGCISTNDARSFIHKLNLQDTKYKYRLPNRSEQIHLIEMALKEFKSNFPDPIDLYRVLDYAWLDENSGDHAHEVCSRKPLVGLCDLLGNMIEWTGQNGYGNASGQGGSWGLSAKNVYSLTRVPYSFAADDARGAAAGFRLIRTLKPQAGSLKFSCDDADGNIRVTAAFDSTAPIFNSVVTIGPKTYKEEYINSSTICGVVTNVSRDCKGEVRDLRGDTAYDFNCSNGIKASVVSSDDRSYLYCSGPGVKDSFKNLMLTGCRVMH